MCEEKKMSRRSRKKGAGIAIGALFIAFTLGFASSYLANVAFFQWHTLPSQANVRYKLG